MTEDILRAIEESRRRVHVEILAQIGAETWTLGSADCTEDGHVQQVAALLRACADELEQGGS